MSTTPPTTATRYGIAMTLSTSTRYVYTRISKKQLVKRAVPCIELRAKYEHRLIMLSVTADRLSFHDPSPHDARTLAGKALMEEGLVQQERLRLQK